ncbi:Hpt domain-containing protein [Rhodocyclus tenuis]|uniref:Chemotaxis protein CheA n=1 Tax=Rhodocyclus tenuis TaxID=1066 RepID=A0A840G5W1_RHOTE|nr:Hpt domain-containing protein [Rhodocyclus tenuis]MBB4246360.1 chemosensory pili system protein ChpA (sensor histidine kinase/response regulator) [Rhodocyclus tenuis]
MNAASEFDTGPLGWVKSEIDHALTRAGEALQQFADGGDTTQLRFCRTHLHQVQGALTIVGLDGLTRFAETAEALLEDAEAGRLAAGGKELTVSLTQGAIAAIGQTLDALLGGAPNQPLRLLPLYRELQAARGKSDASPTDLFFPDLSVRLPRRGTALPPINDAQRALLLRRERARFQRGLINWLRAAPGGGAAAAAAANEMRAAVERVEMVQEGAGERTFWRVTSAFLSALAGGALPPGLDLRPLCGRLDMQLRRQQDGSKNVAERLLRDVLYYVAIADGSNAAVREVQNAYQLAALLPGSDEVVPAEQEATRRRLRDAANAAEESWSRLCAGAAVLPLFIEHAQALTAAAKQLGNTDCRRLAQCVLAAASWLSDDPARQSEALAMEVATAILLTQNAQERYPHIGADFAPQVDVMVARVHACIAGSAPAASADVPVLDEMSRRAQEKLLIAQVAREIQNNLGRIEQTLDSFFRDPGRQEELAELDAPLKQVGGALSMLGHDDAAQALRQCAADIAGFAGAGHTPLAGEFERVAETLSLIGFFVDALAQGASDFARFCHQLQHPAEAAASHESAEIEDAPATQSGGSVEAEIERQKQAAQALLSAYQEQPADASVREELRQSLSALQKDADLVGDSDLGEEAAEALATLDAPPSAAEAESGTPAEALAIAAAEAKHSALAPQAAAAPPPSPETLQLSQASSEEIDAELLEIFLEEAREVLAAIAENRASIAVQTHDDEALMAIRRAFHTLKGSGRMVGLRELGEIAWAVEQTLNLWLRQELAVTPALRGLLDDAQALFELWVEHLANPGSGVPDARPLVALAESLRPGKERIDEALAEHGASQIAPPTPEAQEIAAANRAPADEVSGGRPPTAAESEASTAPQGAEVIALDRVRAERAARDEDAANGAAVPEPESAEQQAGESPPAIESGAEPAAETAADDESAPLAEAETAAAAQAEPELSDAQSVQLADDFPIAPADTQPADEAFAETFDEKADDIVVIDAAPAADADAPAAADKARPDTSGQRIRVSSSLWNIFLEEAQAHLATLQNEFAALVAAPTAPTSAPLHRAAHTLGGIAGTVGLPAINRLGLALEHALLRRQHAARPESSEAIEVIRQTIAELELMLATVARDSAPEEAPQLLAALDMLYPAQEKTLTSDDKAPAAAPTDDENAAATGDASEREAAREPASDAPSPPAAGNEPDARPAADFLEAPPALRDDFDEQLLPLFLEEAEELEHSIAAALRDWQAMPTNEEAAYALARLLHTLKGSARMAGAMTIGEFTHVIETRVEALQFSGAVNGEAVDEIESAVDSLAQLIDRLRDDQRAPGKPATAADKAARAATGEAPAADRRASDVDDEGTALRASLRVRSDLVDRLVNDAGELSIARTRIEGEMRALKDSLLELTESVIRLRRQLRDVDIQAETQMQSRTAQSEERHAGFDPLEFDRFTRFQELTRMMAETVNDVATVQHQALKHVDDTDAALLAQARLNRDLQQELLAVRKAPFSQLADRLHRIVRQTAKELGKRANLDLRGASIEIDRGVLDNLAAPLEHLLRNAVAHGIEAPELRRQRGKNEIGEITLTLVQDGNELLLTLADDGGGLDFAAIRERGIAAGLLAADELTDDAASDELRLVELIFTPGFSTAAELSQVAGRGVGLDVVKTEIGHLGGRIEVVSSAQQGSAFRLYVPLTLALTQALLVRAGSATYAIPSTMIAQALDLKAAALERIREAGAAEWMGARYPFRVLGELFGAAPPSIPVTPRQTWVLLLKSGAQRVAVQVDGLSRAQEIVVKNIGPQLSRVVGIDGATVLGDGQIVLIINPVALAGRPPLLSLKPAAPAPAAQAPSAPTVMVVDDSLTVRKITGRLLTREGYRVLTAKDGVDALEQLLDVVPAVLLVDIEMPRMDGFDFTRNVRADARLKDVPVVMITSRTADKHRQYATSVGVDRYFGKPFQEEELLATVAEFVRKGHR